MFIFVSLAILALAIFITSFVIEVVRTQKYGVREMTPVRVLLNWLLIIIFTSSLTGIGVLSVVGHSTQKVASSTVRSTASKSKKTTAKSSSSSQKKKTPATSSSTSQEASSSSSQEAQPSSTEASTTPASSYVAYASSTTPVTQGSQASYEEYWVEGELTSTTVPYSYTTSETTIVGSRTETVDE